jgi:DNA-directed RNA polymerase subunit RPC12/RpoP
MKGRKTNEMIQTAEGAFPVLDYKSGRRCPHCGSDKWVNLESERKTGQSGAGTGKASASTRAARYGCANCGGEFFVRGALTWKRAARLDQCPHCNSRQVLVAIRATKGTVLACKQCCGMGLYEHPGHEGTITVEDMSVGTKLTDEAKEFFGRLGLQFEIKRAKARKTAGGAALAS